MLPDIPHVQLVGTKSTFEGKAKQERLSTLSKKVLRKTKLDLFQGQ